MKTVTRCKRKSRLSSSIDLSGGISVGVALKQAAKNLAPMKAPALALVADLAGQLEALAPPTSEQTAERLEEVYRIGLAILDAIGPFDLPRLHRVAWGLCDLADRHDPVRPFDWRVVEVHIRALRLFLSVGAEADGAAFDEVIAGLDKAVARQRTV